MEEPNSLNDDSLIKVAEQAYEQGQLHIVAALIKANKAVAEHFKRKKEEAEEEDDEEEGDEEDDESEIEEDEMELYIIHVDEKLGFKVKTIAVYSVSQLVGMMKDTFARECTSLHLPSSFIQSSDQLSPRARDCYQGIGSVRPSHPASKFGLNWTILHWTALEPNKAIVSSFYPWNHEANVIRKHRIYTRCGPNDISPCPALDGTRVIFLHNYAPAHQPLEDEILVRRNFADAKGSFEILNVLSKSEIDEILTKIAAIPQEERMDTLKEIWDKARS